MPTLNSHHQALLMQNKSNGSYNEIESISHGKDRSMIRARPTAIPTPGSKKPMFTNDLKLKNVTSNNNNRITNNKMYITEDKIVAEKTQRNVSQKSSLKVPAKITARQNQAASNVTKPPVNGPNSNTGNAKANMRLHQKTSDTSAKSQKGKAPEPPTRSIKPPVATKPNIATTATSNGNLRSGNGLGGGSVPHKGFSYLQGISPNPNNYENQSFTSKSPLQSRIQADSQANSPLLQTDLTSSLSSIPDDPNYSGRKTPSLPPRDINVIEDKFIPRPKPSTVQPRRYTSSPMNSKIKFSAVSSHPTQLPAKTTSPQSQSHSVKQVSKSIGNSSALSNTERSRKLGGVFSRGNRSGNLPKPFSIPVVPDVPSIVDPVSLQSTKDSLLASDVSDNTVQLSAYNDVGKQISDRKAISEDDSPDKDKSKANGSKRGIFGLRRFMSSKTNSQPQQEPPKQLTSSTASPLARAGVKSTEETSYSTSTSLSTPTYSSEFTDESVLTQPHPGKMEKSASSKPSLADRKATIPKSNLVHSLLNPKAKTADSPEESVCFLQDLTRNVSSETASSCDDENCESAKVPLSSSGLTSVLKNSNLVKSSSSSSLLTDSGSNLSTTPSIRTKKVSFQTNVTICDANGISTFSNGLRPSDDDEDSESKRTDGKKLEVSEDQSLSEDSREGHSYQNVNDLMETDRNQQSVHKHLTPIGHRYRSNTPGAFESYSNDASNLIGNQYFPQQVPDLRRQSYQSAVAAAIRSISNKPMRSSPVYENFPVPCPGSQLPAYEQYVVSCASPVPFITRQERIEMPYKEEWTPLRRRNTIDTTYENASFIPSRQRSCITPVPGVTYNDQVMESVENDSHHDDKATKSKEPSYFQTQGTPTAAAMQNETFKADTPPYYECCEPSKPSNEPVDPNHLNEAIDQKCLRHDAVNTAEINPPQDSVVEDSTADAHMIMIENELANLSGMVDSIIETSNNSDAAKPGGTLPVVMGGGSNHADSENRDHQSPSRREMGRKLLNLRETAYKIQQQLNDIKKQQRTNLDKMNGVITEKARELTQFIALTAGAQQRPLRQRRMRLDQERHTYGTNASRTEKQLTEIEAAVEELRNEVVERRCRVNAREVEALALQLSQAGRTVAKLKGSFPALRGELRTVGAAETEVLYAEEKFVEAEPSRLDEQLKRCKHLTATLFTLKKLASIQEARSRTPTPFSQQYLSATPCEPVQRVAWEEPNIHRSRVLDDVKRMRPDHRKRMESIQEAEISWNKRRKFLLEHDSKKIGKALQIAEKALNRPDYASQIDQQRRAQLIDVYHKRGMVGAPPDSNLTTSESSSIESLPPPPTEYFKAYSSNLPLPQYTRQAAPGILPLPPPDNKLQKSAGESGNPVMSQDCGYLNSSFSSDVGRTALPRSNTGSLPRYVSTSSQRFQHGVPFPTGAYYQGYFHSQGQPQPIKQMERSRSVTPHHWDASPAPHTNSTTEDSEFRRTTQEDRQHHLTQQQLGFNGPNKKLVDQCSKLSQMQKRLRSSFKKSTPTPHQLVTSSLPPPIDHYQETLSSDV